MLEKAEKIINNYKPIEKGKYCVYIHISPSNKAYVGITCRKPETRWGVDGKRYFSSANGHFKSAIRKYGWHSFLHHILIQNISKEDAFYLEKTLIKELNLQDRKCGYNIANGGTGGNNKNTFKVNMYDLKGKYIKTFKTLTDASKDLSVDRSRISYACKHNATVKGYQFKYFNGNVNNIDAFIRKNQTKVNQYTLDNVFIKTWNTCKEASEFYDVGVECITRNCKGMTSNSCGYIWKFA